MTKMRSTFLVSLALALAAGPAGGAAAGEKADKNSPEAAAQKADKDAAKAREKQLKEWKRKYGDGPYPDEVERFTGRKPEQLRPLYERLYRDGEHNAVLNFERVGLAAIELGHFGEAEAAFDGAIARIESIYSKDQQAKAARSKWSKEGIKDFKGEPYERAMAYYYRGLLYLRVGDFENARIMFTNAEYQDTVSEAEEFQSDFAVMNFLAGWAARCGGNSSTAADYFAAAQKVEPLLAPPPVHDNALVLAELGRGPVKIRKGSRNELLAFQASSGAAENDVRLSVGDQQIQPKAASSLFAQATTRGGRPVDSILKGKANFKSTSETLGMVGSMTGMSLMNQATATQNIGMANLGAAFSLFGAASSIVSSGVKPDADIRMWDSLPDRIAVATTQLAMESDAGPVPHPFAIFYAGQSEIQLPGGPVILEATAPKCKFFWVRSQRASAVSPDVPGEDLDIVKARAKQKTAVEKDQRFRAQLMAGSVQ